MDSHRFWIMILYIFIGAVLGTVLGIGLGKAFPILNKAVSFGFTPFTLKLVIMDITFGMNFYLNVGSVIGVILFLYFFLTL